MPSVLLSYKGFCIINKALSFKGFDILKKILENIVLNKNCQTCTEGHSVMAQGRDFWGEFYFAVFLVPGLVLGIH